MAQFNRSGVLLIVFCPRALENRQQQRQILFLRPAQERFQNSGQASNF